MQEPEQCGECGGYFPAECLDSQHVNYSAGHCPLCNADLYLSEVE